MTELTVASEQPIAPVDDLPIAADMTLIARSPDQLQAEQRRLIGWCAAKRNEVAGTIADLEASIAHHRKLKWGFAPLRTALNREKQRSLFYEKVQAALEAGFYIVPNFPCEVFAIRTNRSADGSYSTTNGHRAAINNLPTQKAAVLQIGDGDYKNPTPLGRVTHVTTQKKSYPPNTTETEKVHHALVVDFAEMTFPFAFAKPEVLTATQQAMAMKLFDELGVLPSTQKGDPMVIGRIIRPWQRTQWNDNAARRHLSFLVVWWLDTNTI